MSGVLTESGMCEGDNVASPLVWCVYGEGRVCTCRVRVCVNWMCDVGVCGTRGCMGVVHGEERVKGVLGEGVFEVCRSMDADICTF